MPDSDIQFSNALIKGTTVRHVGAKLRDMTLVPKFPITTHEILVYWYHWRMSCYTCNGKDPMRYKSYRPTTEISYKLLQQSASTPPYKIIPSYSPGGVNMHPSIKYMVLERTRLHSELNLDRVFFIRFRRAHWCPNRHTDTHKDHTAS